MRIQALNSQLKAGDVVHVPSNSMVFRWNDSENAPSPEVRTLDEPLFGLFVKERNDFYSVVVAEGDYWTLRKSDIYKIKEENKDGGKVS